MSLSKDFFLFVVRWGISLLFSGTPLLLFVLEIKGVFTFPLFCFWLLLNSLIAYHYLKDGFGSEKK